MITFEETGTTQPNCEDLDGMSVFKSTSGSDLNISHLEKYIDWKYSKTVRPAQTKTEGCCSEDINCSTSLFNDQNNKQYGSFPQNKLTLREHIIPSEVDFDIVQTTPLEERPGNITNSSFTGFLLQQIEFMREEARFKNFIIDVCLLQIHCCVKTNFSLVNLFRAVQINQTIQVISLWVKVI